ncbi:MAG: ATP-binding protein [Pseudomonadota bacterium]|jgi:two-component system phosphate regulon sensor histidine kinase PhoR
MDLGTVSRLLSGLPLPVLVVGAGQRVVAANPAIEALFGAPTEGRNVASVVRHPAFLAALDRTLSAQETTRARISVPSRGAGDLVMLVHVAPFADVSGAPGALVAFEDQTALERAELMRRDFVANVSHELRTPLTALVGFIETLRCAARDDAPARERFLTIMEREASRMIRLVGDLLSLSRVEADERLRPGVPTDIAAVVRSVLLALRPQAEAAGVALEAVGLDGAVIVPADADQMTQVFHNLVENALKYAAGGKRVTVEAATVERDPVFRGAGVRISVVDYGEGIEPIHLPRLTERFYRVDSHRSREKGGTGLGLAIVKHIVNRHRGRLKIESEPGKGSRFIILLPKT